MTTFDQSGNVISSAPKTPPIRSANPVATLPVVPEELPEIVVTGRREFDFASLLRPPHVFYLAAAIAAAIYLAGPSRRK